MLSRVIIVISMTKQIAQTERLVCRYVRNDRAIKRTGSSLLEKVLSLVLQTLLSFRFNFKLRARLGSGEGKMLEQAPSWS